jgi:hypothetical protein
MSNLSPHQFGSMEEFQHHFGDPYNVRGTHPTDAFLDQRALNKHTARLEHEALEPRTKEQWGHAGGCTTCKPSLGLPRPDHEVF